MARPENLGGRAYGGVGVHDWSLAHVVHRVDDDVDAQPAVRRYRLIHGAIKPHDNRLKVGALTSRPQPDPRLESGRGHLLEVVDPQVHPQAV